MWVPQEFWGSGENGFLFSGIWGALVIILGGGGGGLGSKLTVLEFTEPWQKQKKIKEKPPFCLIF